VKVKILKPAISRYGTLAAGREIDIPDDVARGWIKAGLASVAEGNLSTLDGEKSGVDKILPAEGEPRIFIHYKKRGRKPKELPEALIRQLAEEGLGSKAIASRLVSELGIEVSYKTIQRLLSGKRKKGDSQHV